MLNSKNKADLPKQKPQTTSQKDTSPVRKPITDYSNRNRLNVASNINPSLNVQSNIQTASNSKPDIFLNRVINVNKLFEQESDLFFPESKLFEDKYFECINENLSNDFRTNLNIEWLRPKEITEQGSLDIENEKLSRPVQKQLGDCWFVCACLVLFNQTRNDNLLRKVILNYQHGMLKFQFYAKGISPNIDKFVQISIDDRLPVKKLTKDLIYGSCIDSTKFWFPLLEKAYTKFYGSNYENIVSGIPEEAFIDLCGAFTLYLNPQDNLDIKLIIEKLFLMKENNKLIACADTIPLQATVNSASKSTLEARKSHSFVISNISNGSNNGVIIELKNPWSSSNIYFRYLWYANCKKKKVNDKDDFSEVSLKLQDFQKYFGAVTLALHIPDSTKDENENFVEFCGSFNKMYSLMEINSQGYNLKESFINYMKVISEFYLLEIKPTAQSKTHEILFNLTQYSSHKERNRLRLSFIEVNDKLVANYSNRFETNRNGRTLSKLFSLQNKAKNNTLYLICIVVIANDRGEETQSNKEVSISYLFRCLHESLRKEEIEIRKLNSGLANENIQLVVNSCTICNKVFVNEIQKIKVHKLTNDLYYCLECYQQLRGLPRDSFRSLIDEYNSVL